MTLAFGDQTYKFSIRIALTSIYSCVHGQVYSCYFLQAKLGHKEQAMKTHVKGCDATIICHDNYFILLSGLSHVIVFRNRSNIWKVVMNIKLYENIVMPASPNANLTIRRSHELE